MNEIGTDILLERPYLFEVDGERFAIYPPSIGVLSLMQIRLRKLNISQKALESVGSLELLRVADVQKDECCQLIAMATRRSHEDALNDRDTQRIAEMFSESLETDEVATLLVAALQFNRYQQWMDDAGIAKERKRMADVMRHKDRKGSVSFGGKSLFGQLIDPAMERYGWTYEYVVWGISLAVLEILMADKISEIIISDEERKKIPARLLETEDAISGDDPRNWNKVEQIMNMT